MIKYVHNIDEDKECYETGILDDNNFNLNIYNLDGYAGKQGLEIGGWELEWNEIDILKKSIALAEKRWRKQ